MKPSSTVLILGGTSEAYELAKRLVLEAGGQEFRILTSLRGSTQKPRLPKGDHRIGGFGGVDGLENFLREEEVSHVIDATHPFAEQISRNAVHACRSSQLPLIRLERPSWEPESEDNWILKPDLKSAAEWLMDHPQRVLLTTGHRDLDVFRDAHASFFLIRTIEPVSLPEGFPNAENLISRGPFSKDEEIALMRSWKISLLLCKNSGGEASFAKLLAARELSIPVLMVKRPELPEVSQTESIDEVVKWLAN